MITKTEEVLCLTPLYEHWALNEGHLALPKSLCVLASRDYNHKPSPECHRLTSFS